jgi:hypothetical protein
VQDLLREYEFDCSDEASYFLAEQWVAKHAEDTENSERSILRELRLDASSMARSIAQEVLADMAEERPGTNPFDHPGTIPVSLPLLIWVTQGLTVASDLAMVNGQTVLAHEGLAGVVSFLSFSVRSIPRDEIPEPTNPDVEVNDNGFDEGFPIILLPQSAVAYIARRIEGAMSNLEEGHWALPLEGDDEEELETVMTNFFNQSYSLRALNQRYGQSGLPTERS